MRIALTTIAVAATIITGSTTAQTVQGKSPVVDLVRSRSPWFTDESVSRGALFEHQDGAYSYAMGSGAAWLDFENDGDEDLVVLSAVGAGAVLRNEGGVFTDVTDGSGINVAHGSDPIGVICADYDQDGLTDIYFCNTSYNNLYRNQGGTFTDVAPVLNAHGGADSWSTSASWADFDLDGDLDIYVGNYIKQLHFPYHYGEPNVLLENRGPGVSPQFEDVAPELRVDNVGLFGPSLPGYFYTSPEGEPTAGCTLSTCTLDYDEDGDPDLMVGNDFGQFVISNKLYRNEQAGAGMDFADLTTFLGFDTRPHFNMGIVPSDYDHDGDWDFYHSNLGDNLLLRNDNGFLVDATYQAGPVSGLGSDGLLISSWSMIFEDFNNDTFEDIVVANGYIPAASFIENQVRARNHLWISQGDGTFQRVPNPVSGMDDPGPARGMAKVDLNSDGNLDFYVQNNGADYVAFPQDRSRLFISTGEHADGHWLELDVAGRFSNGEGFGTRIDVEIGSTVLKRQVLCDPVFLSNHTRMVHLGLGAATEADRLTIHWPSGIVQTWIDVPADQRIPLLEPAVTLESVDPAQYAAGVLTLSGSFRNHDSIDQVADVKFELVRTSDGATQVSKSTVTTVAAGQTQSIQVLESISPASYALLQGSEFEVRVFASASGATDSDLDLQILP